MNFFDLHADVPIILDSDKFYSSVVDLCKYPFEKYIQVMAIFLRENEKNLFDLYKHRSKITKAYLKKCDFPLIEQNVTKSSGALLSVENAGFLAEDINYLYKLKDDGVKFLSLTWNSDNMLASGANGNGGITSLGKDVINLMNELDIALDVSHLSHKATIEGIELANKVLASHSVPFILNSHNRNIKYEALLALKQKNGIVGICFYPLFLGGDDVTKRLIEAVEYLISLGMENNIAIGTDFDGADMTENLSKTAHIPSLFNAFCSFGLKKSMVNKIFYQNAIAFFSEMCENK